MASLRFNVQSSTPVPTTIARPPTRRHNPHILDPDEVIISNLLDLPALLVVDNNQAYIQLLHRPAGRFQQGEGLATKCRSTRTQRVPGSGSPSVGAHAHTIPSLSAASPQAAAQPTQRLQSTTTATLPHSQMHGLGNSGNQEHASKKRPMSWKTRMQSTLIMTVSSDEPDRSASGSGLPVHNWQQPRQGVQEPESDEEEPPHKRRRV